MGWVDLLGRKPSRDALLKGDIPKWIKNSKRKKYIIQVLLSCPPWQSVNELRQMQKQAKRLTEETGVLHTLDHDVPLNHPAVCGLSVPWNIKIIPWAVNCSKGNEWHPDQEVFDFGDEADNPTPAVQCESLIGSLGKPIGEAQEIGT